MKALNKTATNTFNAILARLGDREHIKIDNTNEIFMPLSVNRISKDKVALSHYGEQNGDLMADPDMVFYVAPGGKIYPCIFQNDYMGSYREAVRFTGEGKYEYNPRMQADLVYFANIWMKNIKHQQGI